MSVRSNGDSNNKRVVAGSVVFPAGTQWPNANSDTFTLAAEFNATNHTTGLPVTFVSGGGNAFKTTPVVTATISGGTAYGLVVRAATIGKDKFTIYMYNSTSSFINLGFPLTVNWVATEASPGKLAEDPATIFLG